MDFSDESIWSAYAHGRGCDRSVCEEQRKTGEIL